MAAEWEAEGASRTAATFVAILIIRGSLEPNEIDGLCRAAAGWIEDGAGVVVCDVSALEGHDLVAVEALARLRLLTERRECRMRVRGPDHKLVELLELVGLREVIEER